MFKLFVAIVVRSLVPLGAATFVLASTTPAVADPIGQDGAALGRITLVLVALVFLTWALWPWRRVFGRMPWGFIVTFVIALGVGALIMTASPEPGGPELFVGFFFSTALLSGAYGVLFVETVLARQRYRRPQPMPQAWAGQYGYGQAYGDAPQPGASRYSRALTAPPGSPADPSSARWL